MRKLLQRYIVDLSSYSDEESERLYEILDGTAFMCNFVANKPKVYEVFWEHKDSIESILHIPSRFITHLK